MSQLNGIGRWPEEAAGAVSLEHIESINLIGLKAVSPRHAPRAGVEAVVDDAVEQLPRLQEYVGLGELFDFGGGHAAHQVFGFQLIW